jgi:hypothetical protein
VSNQELQLWLGPTRVVNPSGVTVWDVRQAVLRAPRARCVAPRVVTKIATQADLIVDARDRSRSALVCFLDIPPYKAGSSSGGSVLVGPGPPEWVLAHE